MLWEYDPFLADAPANKYDEMWIPIQHEQGSKSEYSFEFEAKAEPPIITVSPYHYYISTNIYEEQDDE